jgi:hypothetical protein
LRRRLRPNEEYRIAVVSKDAGLLFLDAIHDQKLSMTALVVNYSGEAGMGREREIGQKNCEFYRRPVS